MPTGKDRAAVRTAAHAPRQRHDFVRIDTPCLLLALVRTVFGTPPVKASRHASLRALRGRSAVGRGHGRHHRQHPDSRQPFVCAAGAPKNARRDFGRRATMPPPEMAARERAPAEGRLSRGSIHAFARHRGSTTVDLPITTTSLLLRKFVPRDASGLLALSRDESWRTWLPSQIYRDHGHVVSVLEHLVDQYDDPGNPRRGPYVLAITHRADRALIGHAGFSPLEDEVEIGFSIAAAYQKQGLGAEAIDAASRWAFERFGLERILAVTAAANVASKRTLVRAGFVYERDVTKMFQGTEQVVSVYARARTSGRHPSSG